MPLARWLVLAVLATQASSCAESRSRTAWTEADSSGIRIVVNERPSEQWSLAATPALSLGATSDDGPTQFFRVRSIVFLPGRRFAVANADTEQVRFFSTTGEFLGAVGRQGNGP